MLKKTAFFLTLACFLAMGTPSFAKTSAGKSKKEAQKVLKCPKDYKLFKGVCRAEYEFDIEDIEVRGGKELGHF